MQQRNPVLTPAVHVALATVVLGALLILVVQPGPRPLAAGVLLLGLLLAWGWAGALGLPSPRGTAAVVALGSILLVGSVVPDLVPGQGPEGLEWSPVAAGAVFLLAFAHQLFRRDGRPRVVESVSAVVLALALVAGGTLLVPLADHPVGTDLVVAAVAAAVLSSVTDIAGRWLSTPWLVPLSMVAGGAAAVGAAVVVGAELEWTTCLLLGVATGATSQCVRAVLAVLPSMAWARPRLVAAAASLLVAGPLAYAVARVLVPDVLPG